jgi:hypothetical protein
MTNGKAKFGQDVSYLVSKLIVDLQTDQVQKINELKQDLLELHRQNVVKINHSVMELICAKYLILKSYDVQIEYKLSDILTCDLYSTKGLGNLIVEIETGYIPPEHALDPLTYTYTRLASKIVRYSSFAGKFAIGVPAHYVLPLPRVLAVSPRRRKSQEVELIKNLCDHYYQNPPVSVESIWNARIHEIFIIDVDRLIVQEMDPESYLKRAINKGVLFSLKDENVSKRAKAPKFISERESLSFYMK